MRTVQTSSKRFRISLFSLKFARLLSGGFHFFGRYRYWGSRGRGSKSRRSDWQDNCNASLTGTLYIKSACFAFKETYKLSEYLRVILEPSL